MCKGFGSSLTGPALQWFTNLPNASIDSFASLTDRFVEQFASSRNIERTADDLYEVIQKRGEPLRNYVDSDLYKELTKYQCRTMEDVLSRAWAQIRDLAMKALASEATIRVVIVHQPNRRRPTTNITWPDISNLSISHGELVGALKQLGGVVRWPKDESTRREARLKVVRVP
ncbi:unnamed protein product [Microthlaspi erraticum]|uniref:Retrotransposon gag domain-containing protein n=1 Tax=Microthlaspi erraticum TaxID=1685480 RepID=A0A6D2I3S6_9BRAS|nr:unnamed protein product [Microthlaspi erraticum]